jgi:hypothetical protein
VKNLIYPIIAFILICGGAAFARVLFSQSFARRKAQLDEQERRLIQLFNQMELSAGEVRKETADQLATLKRLSELLETVKEGKPLEPAYRREAPAPTPDDLDAFPTFDGEEFPFDSAAPVAEYTDAPAAPSDYEKSDFAPPEEEYYDDYPAEAAPARRKIVSEEFDFDYEEEPAPRKSAKRQSSLDKSPWEDDDIDDGEF